MGKKQKICLFNTCRTWGGGEKWHLDTAIYLSAQGYDVFFVTNTKSELLGRVKTHDFRHYSLRITNLSFMNIYKYLVLRKIFIKEQPDTIILCLPIDVKVGGVAAKWANIQRIAYGRACAIPIKDSAYNRFLFKRILTNVIANSKATKATIVQNNRKLFPEHKIKILYNGIDIHNIDHKSTIPLRDSDEIILGTAGRIVEQKNHRILIDVAKLLKKQKCKFKIVIAGEGDLQAELESLALREGVSDCVTFIGFVDNINAFMNSIDIFVLPSKGEGFGYVAAEAMIAKKPVIAFNVSSSPELILEGKNGLLVEPYDVNSFTEKVVELMENPEKRNAFGEFGYNWIINNFSEDSFFSGITSYLEDINPKKSVKISASIITLNEEKNIERCLVSLKDVADEVVVVDSFSTDRTGEICEKYGVKFIKHEFKGHIEQKNFAVTQCSHDYILAIDADEALSDTLRRSIQKVKGNWDADAYIFNRMTYFCGRPIKYGDWYPDPSLRLWDRRQGRWGGLNPHDKFELYPGSSFRYIDGILDHFSYYKLEDHLKQINKFSTISAASKFQNGKRSNLLKIFFYPQWRFFRDYVIKLGFMDGYYGFVVCTNIAYEVFLKYVKLRQLQKTYRKPRNDVFG